MMSARRYPSDREKKRSFWQSHIDACNAEGMTQVAYCRAHGLAVATYQYWKRLLRDQPEGTNRLRLVPIDVKGIEAKTEGQGRSAAPSTSIQIALGRFTVTVPQNVDAETLRTVVAAIGGF
jgi:hypothetical protein